MPHSVVDFYKGKQCVKIHYISEDNYTDVPELRQKNIDYSLCQALLYNSTGITKALIIYDVACQKYVKFAQRVEVCPALQIPNDMDIVTALGKFHLTAHKLVCFGKQIQTTSEGNK